MKAARLPEGYDGAPVVRPDTMERLEMRIKALEVGISEAMYAPSIDEALAVATKFKHEFHILSLHGQRYELQFLKMRREQLKESSNG